jgi:hypothetical protein
VVVEGKRLRDLKPAHDRITGAIRETPTLVLELPEREPRLGYIIAGDQNNIRQLAAEQHHPDFHRNRRISPRS